MCVIVGAEGVEGLEQGEMDIHRKGPVLGLDVCERESISFVVPSLDGCMYVAM